MTSRLVTGLLASALCITLSACRYNYVPLIPPQAEVRLPARITNATLVREEQQLKLGAQIHGRFEPGYLTVQWFDGSRELGTDSVYLDSALREAVFRLDAPAKGAYRAVLSFGGIVLRQVELYEVSP
ncbi:hypothetical protein DEDE109153_07780 [Deinococcus deserti]|uniref:Ig-like domain-containing protein n=1 Tax=Deinococcus deserti (strain DSM 17065 / CIP 109153 / LMG 22923 / VCD115) TaxID=546414 RepID=C1CWC2_DEIDV|nr:hypothetical protein [Deinococcus deserti]ACO46489.1 conserved hypothetical protein, precursor [Deinococcus deserti VCD115]